MKPSIHLVVCGRYVSVVKISKAEKVFGAQYKLPEYESNFNVSPGNLAPVITNHAPDTIQLFQFGFSPGFAKKRTYVLNARTEGNFNQENDPSYAGKKGIFMKPFFRQVIRQKRCLVLADAIIEGTTDEGLKKPYLVFLRDRKGPFSMPGLWDEWVNKDTGEVVHSFCIITYVANELFMKLPHMRAPVIFNNPNHARKWLDDQPLEDVLNMLEPPDAQWMNAYPIDPTIRSPKVNDRNLLRPLGPRILKEIQHSTEKDTELWGMGESPARRRRNRS